MCIRDRVQRAAAGTGPQAYQQSMSPFQKDVIDATLKEFDTQAAKGLPTLAAQAINAGAFGGGREGVQRAEYQQASDRNRAALQSQLLQSGFGQAQQLAQRNFQNRMGLAQLSPSLVGQQISALGALGTQQQAQQQAQLSAQQQLLQQQANRPLDLAQQLGQGVTSLIWIPSTIYNRDAADTFTITNSGSRHRASSISTIYVSVSKRRY